MEQCQLEGWIFKISKETRTFEGQYRRQALDFLNKWKTVFPYEDTWVQREWGVPSVVVRLDCVPKDGILHIFEAEERPAGLGLSAKINPKMRARLRVFQCRYWPKFKCVVSGVRRASDDIMWLDKLDLQDAKNTDDLLLIRAEPHELDYHDLAHRSVSTVKTKGNKAYGAHLGLWREVTIDDINDLPWQAGFTLKPLQGSKTNNVEIWHPEKNRYSKQRIGGATTRTRIAKSLETNGRMYCQPLIQPLQIEVDGRAHFMCYRVYFAYNPQSGEFLYIGGVWNSRPNLIIHGASDAVFGPVD